MHFLKCTNCGFLNEVKTEYLTFCSHCNVKLTNNFREWSLKYQNKSFPDFQKEICISQIQLDKQNKQQDIFQFNKKEKFKKDLLASLILVITVLTSVALIGYFIQSIPVGNELAGLAQYIMTLIICGFILFSTLIINILLYRNLNSIGRLVWISLGSLLLISLISWKICI